MKKISIKREQSQAGLSFAERENRRSLAGGESKFRPQVKNKLLLLLVLLVAVVSGAWAADGIECSASDIGKVICTDGSIYAKVSDVPTGKTAAAMIAYIDMENNYGLALALSDEGSMKWSDAKTACEGKSAVAGGTWVLPSKEQWEAMGAKESNSASAKALRDGFNSVGGIDMQSGAYWSSTANDANDNKAWRYYFTTGYYWQNNVNKTENNYVRACLTFNILVAPPTYSITLAEGTEDAKNWTVPTEAAAGTEVTATYKGEKKVKSVKAVKKGGAEPASLIVNPVVGQIIGSDGKNYDANATLPTGVTAVAVIAYVGSETGDDTYKNGLAIALADEFSGMRNWSTAKSTCEGKTAITGAKWCLPSQDQWKQMFKANGGNDARYTGLNTTITTAGGTTLQESNGYWSSSEYQKGANAYYVNLDYDFAGWGYDSESYGSWRVRACLAF